MESFRGILQLMIFEVMIFDLDDTLYPSTSGVWEAIGVRIDRYMHERVHIPVEQVPTLRQSLFHQYGTTLRGLVELYHVDAQDYLDYVHDINLSRYLRPDAVLRETLNHYPQRKVIFTNASSGHAQRVISQLGLEGVFEKIIDIRAIEPYCKPQIGAFQKAFELAEIQSPGDCIMFDDSTANLLVARDLGMFTVHVGHEDRSDGVDASIVSLLDLPSVVPIME